MIVFVFCRHSSQTVILSNVILLNVVARCRAYLQRTDGERPRQRSFENVTKLLGEKSQFTSKVSTDNNISYECQTHTHTHTFFMNVHVCVCMDGCKYVRMGVWMYGCMDVWMYGCMDGGMDLRRMQVRRASLRRVLIKYDVLGALY